MYQDVLPAFPELKHRVDPRGVLGSDFLERAFGDAGMRPRAP